MNRYGVIGDMQSQKQCLPCIRSYDIIEQARGRHKEENQAMEKAKENANARWLIRVNVFGPAQHGIERKKNSA